MNHRKLKVNLNHHIFMLYKSAETCHLVPLTNILIFVTCGASYYMQVCSVQPPIQSLYHRYNARMFWTLAHKSSIPMGNFYMQERFLHSRIRLLYPWVWCIYIQECSVHLLVRLLFPWVQCHHCGRNTHFGQIYFGVPNFNFKNIYMKFE